MTPRQKEALERLIAIAQSDTGQSRKAADFLLAWWNARENGGFDLTDLWGVDAEIAQDMIEVFKLVATSHNYPDAFGYRAALERIWELWRKPATEPEPQP